MSKHVTAHRPFTPDAPISSLGWLRGVLVEAARCGVTHLETHVLAIIAARAGPRGKCYAGAARLAQECGLTAGSRRFYEAVRRLVDLGFLELVTERINSRRTRFAGYRVAAGSRTRRPRSSDKASETLGRGVVAEVPSEVPGEGKQDKNRRAAAARGGSSPATGRTDVDLSPDASVLSKYAAEGVHEALTRRALRDYSPRDLLAARREARARRDAPSKKYRVRSVAGFLGEAIKNGSIPTLARAWRARVALGDAQAKSDAADQRADATARQATAQLRVEEEIEDTKTETARLDRLRRELEEDTDHRLVHDAIERRKAEDAAAAHRAEEIDLYGDPTAGED